MLSSYIIKEYLLNVLSDMLFHDDIQSFVKLIRKYEERNVKECYTCLLSHRVLTHLV